MSGGTHAQVRQPLEPQSSGELDYKAEETPAYDPITLEGYYPTVRFLSIVNRRTYAFINTQYLVQVSSEGYGREGHATITFFRITNDGIRVDGSFGLYANNRSGKFENSFVLRRNFDDSRLVWKCDDCKEYFKPTQKQVNAYRDGGNAYFGYVPPELAERLIKESGNASFILLDPDDYFFKSQELAALYGSKSTILTERYLKNDFRKDWQQLANHVCMNTDPFFHCKGVGDESKNSWPQAHFASIIKDVLAEPILISQLTELSEQKPQKPISLTTRDKLKKWKGDNETFTGNDFACFERFTTSQISTIGRSQYITAYSGDFRNGKPHGKGTLYLGGSCPEVQSKPRGRLVSEFTEGVPHGSATIYNDKGYLVLLGTLKQGYLDGQARFFDGYGSERSLASYEDGKIKDGPITYSELDYFFLNSHPTPTKRIFSGTIKDSKLLGSWEDLAISAAGAHTGIKGRSTLFKDKLLIDLSDGFSLSGQVVRDYQTLKYRFKGEGHYYWPNGDVMEGVWDEAGKQLDQRLRFFDRRKGEWFPVNKDRNGNLYYEYEIKIRKPSPWAKLTGLEDLLVDQVNRAGHGFEHFLCRLVGKKEGVNCHVSAGVEGGSSGPVLTDGSGTPSDVPPDTDIDWDARLSFSNSSEMSAAEKTMEAEAESPFFTEIASGTVFRAPANELKPPITSFIPRSLVYGQPTISGALRAEVGGKPYFGAPRKDTVTDENGNRSVVHRVHNGTDYSTKPGDPVLSPIDGTVTFARNDENPTNIGRNFIRIENAVGERVEITYAHPLQGPLAIKVGSRVARGSQLGIAGDLLPKYGPGVPNHIHVQNWVPGPTAKNPGFWVSPDGIIRIKVHPSPR